MLGLLFRTLGFCFRAEELKGQLLSITQKTADYVADFQTGDGLLFDPNDFKANRIVRAIIYHDLRRK